MKNEEKTSCPSWSSWLISVKVWPGGSDARKLIGLAIDEAGPENRDRLRALLR